MLGSRTEGGGVKERGHKSVCHLGESMDELAVRSSLLIIAAVLVIAISVAIVRAITRKDKEDE